MPIRGAIDPFLGKCRIYIFCLVVFFPTKNLKNYGKPVQNGKKSEPPTFWGEENGKKYLKFHHPSLSIKSLNSIKNGTKIRGAEVLQRLHGSHHLRHVGAETNQWCLLHPSQAPVGELGLTCTKSEKDMLKGNENNGTHLSREVRKIIDSKVPLKGDMLVPRRVGPFNRLFHFQTNSHFKTLAQVSSIANGTFQCVLPMPHTTATSQNVEKN